MKQLKSLAYITALFAYSLIVLGAVVRITESGLGCGDHWPLCNGRLIPAFTDYHVVIEYAHRIAAVGLFALIVLLAGSAFALRRTPGVSGRGGVLRPALLALGLYFGLAVLGAVVVKLDLHASAVVLHLSAAMGLLATILVAGWRASRHEKPAAAPATPVTGRTRRAAIMAVVLTGIAILMGGLTATTGAATACQGFPLCNGQLWPDAGNGGLAHLHWTHRLIAYALLGHLIGVFMGARKRRAPPAVQRWAGLALGAVVLQIIVAATMVLTHLPPSWRGMHGAVGAALWVAVTGLLWRTATAVPPPARC
jgi:heme A synthase